MPSVVVGCTRCDRRGSAPIRQDRNMASVPHIAAPSRPRHTLPLVAPVQLSPFPRRCSFEPRGVAPAKVERYNTQLR